MGFESDDCELVFIGTCYTRSDFHDVLDHLVYMGFTRSFVYKKLYGGDDETE